MNPGPESPATLWWVTYSKTAAKLWARCWWMISCATVWLTLASKYHFIFIFCWLSNSQIIRHLCTINTALHTPPPRQTPPSPGHIAPWADTPPGRHTPWADTPWADSPRPVHAGILTPSPCAVHAGIQSTSGRYASHWNAFLLILIPYLSIYQC